MRARPTVGARVRRCDDATLCKLPRVASVLTHGQHLRQRATRENQSLLPSRPCPPDSGCLFLHAPAQRREQESVSENRLCPAIRACRTTRRCAAHKTCKPTCRESRNQGRARPPTHEPPSELHRQEPKRRRHAPF